MKLKRIHFLLPTLRSHVVCWQYCFADPPAFCRSSIAFKLKILSLCPFRGPSTYTLTLERQQNNDCDLNNTYNKCHTVTCLSVCLHIPLPLLRSIGPSLVLGNKSQNYLLLIGIFAYVLFHRSTFRVLIVDKSVSFLPNIFDPSPPLPPPPTRLFNLKRCCQYGGDITKLFHFPVCFRIQLKSCVAFAKLIRCSPQNDR